MEKYESTVKQVASPIDRVYAKLSDLTSLQALKDRVDDPMFEQMLNSQLPKTSAPPPSSSPSYAPTYTRWNSPPTPCQDTSAPSETSQCA